MNAKKSVWGKSFPLWVVVSFLIIGVFALLKAEVLNRPRKTPKEITQMMVDFTQKDKPSDQDKTEMRKYISQSLLDKWNTNESSSPDSSSSSTDKPVIIIQSVEENGASATATLEISASILKIPVQYKFSKEGNFWTGYKWVISDLVGFSSTSDSNTAKKESTAKADEKATIGEKWSIIVSQPSDYVSSNEFDKPDEGMKFVAVEVQYFNDSASSNSVDPSNLTLRDSEGHSYSSTYNATKEPELKYDTTVTPRGTVKGFITYQVPTKASIISAVYANSSVSLTINF